MKQYIVFLFISTIILYACTKNEVAVITPVKSFQIKGRLDAAQTTLPNAFINKALFTLSYSNINDSIQSNSVLNGSLIINRYSGINNRDTLLLLVPKLIGIDTAVFIPNDSLKRTTIRANNFSFYNGDTAKFTCTNFAVQNTVSKNIQAGKGIFRVGRHPQYVFVKMDSVIKL